MSLPDCLDSNTITYELASPTEATNELLEWTLREVEQIYKCGFRYKKAGVLLNHLVPADQLSIRLYEDESFERSRKLARAMDEINRRYGRETIRFGMVRTDGHWKTKSLRRSLRYTTCLREILHVH